MQSNTPVLIVGAGPTGLLMALTLNRYGIPFRLIEKKSERTQTSNALGIHARTLELLEDLNIVEPFLKVGNPVNGANMHIDGKKIASVDLSKIKSVYPYVLIVPQSETEKILEQALQNNGIEVERNCELDLFEKNNDHYKITLNQNGARIDCSANYIIACDGSHSKVRKLSGLEFKGDDIPQSFALADVEVTTDLAHDKLNIFYSKEGLFATFPLPDGSLRIIADLDASKKIENDKIDIETIASVRSNQHITVKNKLWVSHFYIHSKTMKQMRLDNIFFAGDAAHTHSPAGGQGMNTGMQDAYNLGWKLSLVIQGKANPSILDSYQQERHPVAEELVKQTDKLTRMMLSRNPVIKVVRNFLVGPVLRIPSVNQKLAARLSMLSINYPRSPIVDYKSVISNRSPQPGELMPDVNLTNSDHLQQYLHGKNYWLLIFAGNNPDSCVVNKIKNLAEFIKNNHHDLIHYHVITEKPLDDIDNQLSDTKGLIAKQFNVERAALCLVRPDKYIAYCNNSLNIEGLKKFITGSRGQATG